MSDIYTDETAAQERRISLLAEMRENEDALRLQRNRLESEFITVRREFGRIQRERRKLEHEIGRKKYRARERDYRIRRWNNENMGRAMEMIGL